MWLDALMTRMHIPIIAPSENQVDYCMSVGGPIFSSIFICSSVSSAGTQFCEPLTCCWLCRSQMLI